MRGLVLAFLLLPSLVAGAAAKPLASFRTSYARLSIDPTGSLSAVVDTSSGRDYLASNQPAPVLALRIAGKVHAPRRATWDAPTKRLTLHYDDVPATATVRIVAKVAHVTFELVAVDSPERVELAIWGPYPISIGETIGEIVGVVRDRNFAVGIQALNPKTLGGSPANENDIDAEFGADDTGHYPDLPDALRKGQGFRADTARPMPFGSVLQAYVRNRDQARVIPNWGHERYQVLPYADGGVVGSRIALFGASERRALGVLGAIETVEGLPHPQIAGIWAKQSPLATASYLIVDFSEETVDQAIAMTRRAGLNYLYHSSPFETWGSFRLKPKLFPHGWEGFRQCAEKARRQGVLLGFHTLSNFITPNDPYVTPRPDPRLALVGASPSTAPVDATTREIPVDDPALFTKKSALNTVRLGDELVRFAGVSAQAPWVLTGCERGAFGTQAAAHPAGTAVGRLLDHEYGVFLADADLSQAIARNIAAFCNQTGARQLSFDGLEGNWSTGYGQYGRTLFTHAWYEALSSSARGRVINDASNPGHFNWHMNTRMNWGEPWYAGFRESQTLYRFKNQVLFERNYLPHMLGWFALRPDTGVEDAEWLLARAAGFDAGFTLATSLASTAQLDADPGSADTARRFGAAPTILATIRAWESARMARVFPPAIRERLRDNTREFHLQQRGARRWDLSEVHVHRGTPLTNSTPGTDIAFPQPADSKGVHWIVRTHGKEPVTGLRIRLNGTEVADLSGHALPPGGILRYTGGPEVVITDASWRELARVPVDKIARRVPTGLAQLTVGAQIPAGSRVEVEVRQMGPAAILRPKQNPGALSFLVLLPFL